MNISNPQKNLGNKLEDLGWILGSIVKKNDLSILVHECELFFDIDEQSIGVVITHSCDIATNNIDQLPFIDIIVSYARIWCIGKIN